MSRPERKKSSIGGLGALTPPNVGGDSTTAARQQQADTSAGQPAARESDPVGATTNAPKKKRRNQVAFYIDEDDANRARGTLAETGTPSREGVQSFSEMIVDALMREVERRERKYNNGEQYPPLEARQMRQGRPPGS